MADLVEMARDGMVEKRIRLQCVTGCGAGDRTLRERLANWQAGLRRQLNLRRRSLVGHKRLRSCWESGWRRGCSIGIAEVQAIDSHTVRVAKLESGQGGSRLALTLLLLLEQNLEPAT